MPQAVKVCPRCGSELLRMKHHYLTARWAPCGVCEWREQVKVLRTARKKEAGSWRR